MAIEKSLYAAPQGLDDLAAMDQASPDIEIEIEDPESVDINMGDLSIHMEPDKGGDDFNINLAEEISEEVLQSLLKN
jgi:hypothetical protein